MPNPVLPSAALNHMSGRAFTRLWESDKLPFERFSILYYGEIECDEIVALLGEVDRDTWGEDVRFSDDEFTYEEISETADQVVLYDAARDRTLTIDWTTFDVTIADNGTVITYDVIDSSSSFSPYII